MADGERDNIEGACNEPQPWNWKHACQLRPGHKGAHRVNKGVDDLAWLDENGPVDVVSAFKTTKPYVKAGER